MFEKFKKINKLNVSNNLNTTNTTTNTTINDINLRNSINNTNLQWFVFRYNFNNKKLEVFNVFDNSMFSDDIKKLMYDFIMNNISKNEFVDNVDRKVLYYFGFNVEYEIIISPTVGNNYYERIDIRNQIHLNWNKFINYLFDVCSSFLKCFADVKCFEDVKC